MELAQEQFAKLKDDDFVKAEKKLVSAMVGMLGIRPRVHLLAPHSVVRSEGKAVRVVDKRKLHD